MVNSNDNKDDPVRNAGFSNETAPELQFASSLNAQKKSHKVIACIMLIAMIAFVLSALIQFF